LLNVDFLARSAGVTIPCRPDSGVAVKMESDLSSETVTWTDATGRDLDNEGHFKVDAANRLVFSGVQVVDAGVYVCTVSKITSGDVITVIRHVVKLNGMLLFLR